MVALLLCATILYSSIVKSKIEDRMSIKLKEKELVGGKRKRELIAVYIPKEKKVSKILKMKSRVWGILKPNPL